MKKIFNIVILLCVCFTSDAQSPTIDIIEAAKLKLFDYKITGNNKGHYGECMSVQLRSKVSNHLYIDIKTGLMLMCEDTAIQDMVVSKQLYVTLPPKQTINFNLFAMCSELHNGSPTSSYNYKIGKMGDAKLVAITNTIEEMSQQNTIGQWAVWAYRDNLDFGEAASMDSDIAITISILNKAGVKTILNSHHINQTVKKDIPDTTSKNVYPNIDKPKIEEKKVKMQTIEDEGDVNLDKSIVYKTLAIVILLFGTFLYILGKKRKKNNAKKSSTKFRD